MAEPLSGGRSPSQVFLVDEQSVAREGLRHLFNEDERLSVAGDAKSGEEALAQISEVRPDVAVVSVAPKGDEGMGIGALLHELTDEHPEIGVVIVSEHEEAEYVEQVIQAGADGYVLEEALEERLPEAVKKVSEGEYFMDPALEEVL